MSDTKNNAEDSPRVVSSHDIHIDAEYAEWIAELKHRYRSAQVKAAVRVNAEKLLFNWQLGRDLVQKKAEERWGAGVVEQVSLDLKREFPNAGGFSTSNLWFMKRWYLFYTQGDSQILEQAGKELQLLKNQHKTKLYQLVKNWMEKNFTKMVKNFHYLLLLYLGDTISRFYTGANPLRKHCSISLKL